MNPTLQEVRLFVCNYGLAVNAQEFFDYYNERQWLTSKGETVKDWKKLCLAWARRQAQKKDEIHHPIKRELRTDVMTRDQTEKARLKEREEREERAKRVRSSLGCEPRHMLSHALGIVCACSDCVEVHNKNSCNHD